MSYAGTFNVGITADREAYPDIEVLKAGMRDELQALATSMQATRGRPGADGSPLLEERSSIIERRRTRRFSRSREWAMTTMSIRDVSLFVDVVGHGYPLLLMHGGPGADHWTMLPFRRCADRFTLVFYDHRCNGRSTGAPVSSMTWENLTADADALRQRLGFERWAVLGHSFGGKVALEYALRYPDSLSHLVLLDTGGDSRWAQENAPEILARRGYSPKTVRLARRFYNGRIAPKEFVPALMRLGSAYYHHLSLLRWRAR